MPGSDRRFAAVLLVLVLAAVVLVAGTRQSSDRVAAGPSPNDGRAAAEEFLAEFPVPYPSIQDPDAEQVARSIAVEPTLTATGRRE